MLKAAHKQAALAGSDVQAEAGEDCVGHSEVRCCLSRLTPQPFSLHGFLGFFFLSPRVLYSLKQFHWDRLSGKQSSSSGLVSGVNKGCFCPLSGEWKGWFIERKLHCIIHLFSTLPPRSIRGRQQTEPDEGGDLALSVGEAFNSFHDVKCKSSQRCPTFFPWGWGDHQKLLAFPPKNQKLQCQGSYRPSNLWAHNVLTLFVCFNDRVPFHPPLRNPHFFWIAPYCQHGSP